MSLLKISILLYLFFSSISLLLVSKLSFISLLISFDLLCKRHPYLPCSHSWKSSGYLLVQTKLINPVCCLPSFFSTKKKKTCTLYRTLLIDHFPLSLILQPHNHFRGMLTYNLLNITSHIFLSFSLIIFNITQSKINVKPISLLHPCPLLLLFLPQTHLEKDIALSVFHNSSSP